MLEDLSKDAFRCTTPSSIHSLLYELAGLLFQPTERGSSAPKSEEGLAVSAFMLLGALSLHGSSVGEARWRIEETLKLRRGGGE